MEVNPQKFSHKNKLAITAGMIIVTVTGSDVILIKCLNNIPKNIRIIRNKMHGADKTAHFLCIKIKQKRNMEILSLHMFGTQLPSIS
jgi:hypothetical protein